MAEKKSFFAKVKQWLGIGTVKVGIEVDDSIVTPNTREIRGRVKVIGKSDCHINSINLVMQEYWKQKEVSGKEIQKCFEMGQITLTKAFDIKNGETQTVEFSLPVHYEKSAEDQLIAKRGMLGKLGSLSAGLRQKSDVTLCATADVEGAALDPNQIIHMTFKREG